MQIQQLVFIISRNKLFVIVALSLVAVLSMASHVQALTENTETNGRLITVYDRGEKRVILTHSQTVGDALKSSGVFMAKDDVVEPTQDTKLVASSYTVNVYRARPVTIIDGPVRQKIMTAAQSAKDIAASAGTILRDEDIVKTAASTNIIADGAGVMVTIDRATEFSLKLYGKPVLAYTQSTTVGDMLSKKGVKLASTDTVSVPLQTPLTAGLHVEVWREGVQTATVEEAIDFPIRIVLDADRQIGSKTITEPGVKGKKDVVYEITAKGGKEVTRKAIQSVTTLQPKAQVQVVGIKPDPRSLTKSKGAQQFTDNRGVTHRETYYDLPMNVVIGACGGGGYTVRADGAKVDKDGYILVAANYGNYPKCSIVETSMGPGKVYDTGGFAVRHPHGFDLATDWTNGDGR